MKTLALLLVCVLLPATSWAFPDNAVLETFTGSDGTTPPNANWTNGVIGDASGQLLIKGNGASATVLNTNGDAYWDTTSFSANCESYATISSTSGTGVIIQVFCRLRQVGANTTDGYSVGVDRVSGTLTIRRRTNGATSVIKTITQASTVGDKVGIRTLGSQICAWYKVGAGTFTNKGCATDNTYPDGGFIGLGVAGDPTAAIADDFGGGDIAAPCTGATPTFTALGVDQDSVQDCIGYAAAGDTINLPAGTATWTTVTASTPSVNLNKSVTLHGETVCSGTPVTCVDGTIINDGTATTGGSNPLDMTGVNSRVTGISFKDPRSVVDTKYMVFMNCSNCRFDHNSVTQTNTSATKPHGVYAISRHDATLLIDHNYIGTTDGGTDVQGSGGGTYVGDISWSSPLTPGDANAVFMEDNNYQFAQVLDGAYDAYGGARLVFRNNTVVGTHLGGHGLDSGSTYRSVLQQEVYRNTTSNPGAVEAQWFGTRGGFHLIWGNTISATGGSFNGFLGLKNYRSDHSFAVWGICDGTNTIIDKNTTSEQGYACRDQVGRGPVTDPTEIANDWPNDTVSPTFAQPLFPVYSWKNTWKGAEPTVANTSVSASGTSNTRVQTYHIINNRDFYVEVPSFDGTAGTGHGTHAARPATCTTGVAYWETDTGEWDSTNGATADGRLFKCTATDTWTLFYTPYTYPHPLQNATVTAPTGLRLVSQPNANSVCLIWSASDMADLAGYRIYHGISSGVYDPAVSIALNSVNTRHMPDTQYCYSSPVGGTHYFSMTAYNSSIVESSLATEVSATFTALSRATAAARSGR